MRDLTLVPALNRLGLVVVCPITQGVALSSFAVTRMGEGCETQRVVICDQPRTVDLAARGGRVVEQLGDHLMDKVLARLQPIF